jgi:hypothetical protein
MLPLDLGNLILIILDHTRKSFICHHAHAGSAGRPDSVVDDLLSGFIDPILQIPDIEIKKRVIRKEAGEGRRDNRKLTPPGLPYFFGSVDSADTGPLVLPAFNSA